MSSISVDYFFDFLYFGFGLAGLSVGRSISKRLDSASFLEALFGGVLGGVFGGVRLSTYAAGCFSSSFAAEGASGTSFMGFADEGLAAEESKSWERA